MLKNKFCWRILFHECDSATHAARRTQYDARNASDGFTDPRNGTVYKMSRLLTSSPISPQQHLTYYTIVVYS